MVNKSHWDKSISFWRDLDLVSVPIYEGFQWYLFYMWTIQQICFGSCAPVAAPLMPVAIVSQFKRGKSTNQIKNRTQLANKSDCCAACQMNETARRSRSCEITRRIYQTARVGSCPAIEQPARYRDLKQPCMTSIICHNVMHPGWLIVSCAWLIHLN